MPSGTKDRIAETLFKLMQKKPLDKITVKELVEECEVTRQTFYYHFQDILDVLEWSVRMEMERMLRECMHAENSDEAMRIFVRCTLKNGPTLEKLLASQHREAIERSMVKTLKEYLRFLAMREGAFAELSVQDAETALDFYTFAISGTLLIASQKKEADPDQLADQLQRLLGGRFLEE